MAYVEEFKDKALLGSSEEKPYQISNATREEEVRRAIISEDWNALRALSLLPGGFGNTRVEAWQFLLDATPRSASKSDRGPIAAVTSLADLEPHKDERQVGLDTDRSFVLYPAEGEAPTRSKDDLKVQLHHVIVHVLRKRPQLSYFQGYHDILSVLMLTINEHQERLQDLTDEDVAAQLNLMSEKLSLHRLRDSMGPGLEPLVGLLRLVKQLLRVVDPQYAKRLSSTSPLPYFALSNLLTYFSHDVPTLSLIQHIFDYLFSRPPIAVVYLATVFLLVRKEEVEQLYESGDEGMLHSVLCNLPPLLDNVPASPSPPKCPKDAMSSPNDLTESWHEASVSTGAQSPIDPLSISQTWTAADSTSPQSWTPAGSTKAASIPSLCTSPTLSPLPLAPTAGASSKTDEISTLNADSILDFPPLDPSSRPASPYPDEKHVLDSMIEVQRPSRKMPLSLVSILQQADDLFFQHPPNTLQASEIMGPQSVVFTWCEHTASARATGKASQSAHVRFKSESPSPPPPLSPASAFTQRLNELEKDRYPPHSSSVWTDYQSPDPISDDMAERMVLRPELVVLPYKDEDELEAEREVEEAKEARKRVADEKAAKRRRKKGSEAGILRAIGGPKTGVIAVGGMIVVVAVGVVIAVYGRNGEWKKWIGSTLLTRNVP